MRKHNFITLVFILLAATGAGLYFYSPFPLVGQIIFTAAVFLTVGHPKFSATPFQIWTGLVLSVLFGGIIGDWWLSSVSILVFFAANLRMFIFKEAIYSKALLTESILSALSILAYISINLFHHNGLHGWIMPSFLVVLGIIVCLATYPDRVKVRKLMSLGIIEKGTIAPDFTLTNYNGEKISLSDFKDKRDVLLIFVRGDWCPGCHIILRLYERERKKFQEKNVMLFAIGPDPVGVNLEMVKKLGVEFAVLSDEKMEVSKKYCVRIQENVPGLKFDPGIPLPASFLVDKKGIIRYTSRADRAGEFLRPDIIFDVLAKI